MYEYQISVAMNGRFLFRTDKFRDNVPAIGKLFVEKFPKSEGYSVSLSKHDTTFTTLKLDN
jgi:hypothetical protein